MALRSCRDTSYDLKETHRIIASEELWSLMVHDLGRQEV